MPHYKFTEQAERDLDAIIEHTLKNWGQSQALKYVDGLEGLLGKFAHEPSLGINQDRIFKDLLSFPYVSHIVYYVKNMDGVTVMRLLHKRMDTKRHFSATQKIE